MASPKLSSIDTFAGGGGNAHALESMFGSKLYCEICPKVTRILKSVMRRGLIEASPVHPDICTILECPQYKALKAAGGVDLVSGSWPCQDNSLLGKRTGMEGARSGLLRELCALVLDIDAPIFFAENVPAVTRNGSLDYLFDALKDRYDIAYGNYRASELGFMHDRRRFFCVAVRREGGRDVLRRALALAAPPPGPGAEPPRMVLKLAPGDGDRMACMGNAIVPLCSYTAFTELGTLLLCKTAVTGPGVKPPNPKMPFSGLLLQGLFQEHKLTPHVVKSRRKTLIFDPVLFLPPPGARQSKRLLVDTILKEPVAWALWSTPRKGAAFACNYLTTRSMRDLGSQIRWERSTPHELRGGMPNPRFIEYLMGYPEDYTLVTE